MRAFAPGSVTALFAPSADGDGTSHGVSFATEAGVEAHVRPADETRITLDGTPTGFEPVELALESLGVTAAVDLDAGVPVGAGFGASGAATLATGLAANEAFDLGRSHADIVGVAHEAEVAAGTGLGDVFIQERGGLVVGDDAGIRRLDCDAIVEYESYGGIETSQVLGDDGLMERVTTVGRSEIGGLSGEPSLGEVTERGWRFAREIGLPTAEVEDAVSAVEDAGGVASMAMVGETVFGVGVDGVLEGTTRVAGDGARVV